MWNSPAFSLIGIGGALAFIVVGSTLLGRWLDGRFDSGPTWTVVFLVVGLVVGLTGAYRQLMDVLAEIERRRRRGDSE